MARRLLKEFLTAVLLLLVVSISAFLLLHLAPGTPGASLLGSSATDAQIAEFNHQVGYDQPLFTQYVNWLTGALHGDLGVSWQNSLSVGSELASRSLVTLQVVLGALILGTIVGISIGVAQGLRPNGMGDRIVQASSSALAAIPPVWLGLVLSVLIAVELRLLPVSGYRSFEDGFGDAVGHLILPWLAVSLPMIALVARQTRATLMTVMDSEYVASASALGMSMPRVVLRHALRPTLVPVVTLLGISTAVLVGNAVLVETVFTLPGLGSWLVNAALSHDQPVLLAGVLVTAVIVMAARLLAEVVREWMDPRLRGQH